MGRKKKPKEEEHQHEEEEDRKKRREDYSDSSDYEVERRHHDIDPQIQELAYTFGIDANLTQKLNDIMIEDRQRTWEQDLERLYEILKEARAPAAVLTLKLNDMEKGKFVGKAKCGPRVREMARKHRLDKGASSKLEEAMSMREAMGKDIEKDLLLLDEHLAASNAPSKLISMKLESLRKGFNIGHCIYSREPMPGNQGPGVDGVFDKRERRPLGYTDADLDRRFAEQDIGRGSGQLMDEATIRKMMAAERKKHEEQFYVVEEKPEKGRKDKEKDRDRDKDKDKEKDREKDREKEKEKSKEKSKRSRSRSRSRGSPERRKKKKEKSRSRSRTSKHKKEKGRSRSRSRRRSGSREKKKNKSRSRTRR